MKRLELYHGSGQASKVGVPTLHSGWRFVAQYTECVLKSLQLFRVLSVTGQQQDGGAISGSGMVLVMFRSMKDASVVPGCHQSSKRSMSDVFVRVSAVSVLSKFTTVATIAKMQRMTTAAQHLRYVLLPLSCVWVSKAGSKGNTLLYAYISCCSLTSNVWYIYILLII